MNDLPSDHLGRWELLDGVGNEVVRELLEQDSTRKATVEPHETPSLVGVYHVALERTKSTYFEQHKISEGQDGNRSTKRVEFWHKCTTDASAP